MKYPISKKGVGLLYSLGKIDPRQSIQGVFSCNTKLSDATVVALWKHRIVVGSRSSSSSSKSSSSSSGSYLFILFYFIILLYFILFCRHFCCVFVLFSRFNKCRRYECREIEGNGQNTGSSWNVRDRANIIFLRERFL